MSARTQNVYHPATGSENSVARTVQTGPPAPSERPPSRFQSPAIRNVDPSGVRVMAVQCFESSTFARGEPREHADLRGWTVGGEYVDIGI